MLYYHVGHFIWPLVSFFFSDTLLLIYSSSHDFFLGRLHSFLSLLNITAGESENCNPCPYGTGEGHESLPLGYPLILKFYLFRMLPFSFNLRCFNINFKSIIWKKTNNILIKLLLK